MQDITSFLLVLYSLFVLIQTIDDRPPYDLRHEFLKGTNGAQTAADINGVYGQGTTSTRVYQLWLYRFRSGDKSVEGEPRSIFDESKLLQLVNENNRQTAHELVEALSVSHVAVEVVRSLMIIMAVQTVHSSIGSFINVQKLGFSTWGIFEMSIRNAIYNCGGVLLAFLLLGRRRALTITMSFVSCGFLLVLIYTLTGEYSYDTCTSSYVSRDAVGYMILVLMLLAEMSKRAGVMTSMLYTVEYFPTSIRPICISLQYATITSFGALFKMLSEIVLRYGLHWLHLLPIIMCALMSGGSLFLHKKPSSLSAWYADLEPEKKHKELEVYPKPMLVRKTREKKKKEDAPKRNRRQ